VLIVFVGTAAAAQRNTSESPPEAPLALYWSDGGLRAAVSFVDAVIAAETAAFEEFGRDWAAFVETMTPKPTTNRLPSRSSPSTSLSGDCYASELPDYIVDRESGGNPNGTCSDLGAHGTASVEAQNECANRLWDGGAGSSHWAATR
jgi:hypothetical protein